MKKLILWLLFLSFPVQAGFRAPMDGSRLEDLTRDSTIAEWRADHIDSNNDLVDISGHEKTIADQNGPPSYEDSPFQKGNGYRYTESNLQNNVYYERAADEDFYIFDGDHTVTFLYEVGPGDDDFLLQIYEAGVGGFGIVNQTASAGAQAVYYDDTGSLVIDSSYPNAISYEYAVVQVVRSGDNAKCCLNQYCSAWTDVTDYGTITNSAITIGAANGGCSGHLNSNIIYGRIDTEALSDDELNKDFMTIIGVSSGATEILPFVNFTRSTAAWNPLTNTWSEDYRGPAIVELIENVPRVGGKGGGVLIEGQNTNYCPYSEKFDQWSTTGAMAVTANQDYGPDGSYSADKIDNTGGGNNDQIYKNADTTGDITNRTFIFSVFLKADTPHTTTIRITENGVVDQDRNVYVTNNWRRFSVDRTMAGGGGDTVSMKIFGGERGIATGVVYAWGAQLEEHAFTTSYIETPSNSAVTRNADDLTIEIHHDGENRDLLPYTFGPNLASDKLTIYFEAKCEWSGSADARTTKTLFTLGGNTGIAESDRNIVYAYVGGSGFSNGRLYLIMYGDEEDVHIVYSDADLLDYSEWWSFRGVIDFGDLSNMDVYISQIDSTEESNANMNYSGTSGTSTLRTDDSLIRIGQQYNGSVTGDCRFKNLKIDEQIILP